MSGGGIGGTLGGLAGIALAPETGGLSLAIPAILGAGGGYLGGKLSGSQNPLMDALLGGVGGGISGASGLGSSLGIGNSLGLGAEASGAGALGGTLGGGLMEGIAPLAMDSSLAGAGALGNAAGTGLMAGIAPLSQTASPSILSQLGSYISENPLKAALAGNIAMSAAQSLMPHQQVDVGKNAANVLATNPGFNAQLPKYTMQNTAAPYSGNWYTYGETPQMPMYNAQPVKAQGYAHGGKVKGNPLGNPGPSGQVLGSGGGQDDSVPAKLSQGEYVIPADVVSHLGDGTTNAGGKALDKMVHKVRSHKAVKKFPPKAKNPLAYLKGAL